MTYLFVTDLYVSLIQLTCPLNFKGDFAMEFMGYRNLCPDIVDSYNIFILKLVYRIYKKLHSIPGWIIILMRSVDVHLFGRNDVLKSELPNIRFSLHRLFL